MFFKGLIYDKFGLSFRLTQSDRNLRIGDAGLAKNATPKADKQTGMTLKICHSGCSGAECRNLINEVDYELTKRNKKLTVKIFFRTESKMVEITIRQK